MKILIVSNFYPPARPGGYTQWCHEVASELQNRGHEITVLTSDYELDICPPNESNIFRQLHLDGDLFFYNPTHFFLHHKREVQENENFVAQTLSAVQPDIIFIWGMWGLSHKIPSLIERLCPEQVVYFLSDYWPSLPSMHDAYWQLPAHHKVLQLPKYVLNKLVTKYAIDKLETPLEFQHALCVSKAVRTILVNEGIPLQHAKVVHGGTDTSRLGNELINLPPHPAVYTPLKMLYAGQLVPHKGVHTTIEAVAHLVNNLSICSLHLTIIGSGHPTYEESLQNLVQTLNIESYVTFQGLVKKSSMFSFMSNYHVLLFPSIYEEPFARMTQEAMHVGLVVIGTTTGGTKEILQDDVNGLTFKAEDHVELAQKIAQLIDQPALLSKYRTSAYRLVREQYTLEKMVDNIETYLSDVSKATKVLSPLS
ncbi:MAG: glycosyltransferase family 4 protein [Anaerolineales bacterium]|nr:glycosyltransferase family 4 protein [Anaerolineales bacterium]